MTLISPPAAGANWTAYGASLDTEVRAHATDLTDHSNRISALEGAPAVPLAGAVQINSFAGNTFDERFAAARSYCAAQTYKPMMIQPVGSVSLNQRFAWFDGFRWGGPNALGPKNLEIAAALPNHRIQLGGNIGVGVNSMCYSTTQVRSIYVGDLAFQGNNAQQLFHQPSAPCYPAQFHAIDLYGCAGFGTPSAPFKVTQCTFTGHWTVHAYSGDSPFNFAGSDSEFWTSGYVNLQGGADGNGVGGAGRYLLNFNTMSKCNVGAIFVTGEAGWRGVRCQGAGWSLNFVGGRTEGRASNNPSNGSLIRIEDGFVTIRDHWIAYGMSAPTVNGGDQLGMIDVRGGDVVIDRAMFRPADGVAVATPLVYASGANTRVEVARIGKVNNTANPWGSAMPRYQAVSGATIVADSTIVTV